MRKNGWCALLLAFASLILGSATFAEQGMGLHKRVFAVPAPKNVKIDGKLDDWDLSPMVEMFVVSETKDKQSAKFALMYDSKFLYIGAIVRDSTPMMNRHNPANESKVGWNADSCQFRISLDPKLGYPVNFTTWGKTLEEKGDGKVGHLTLWYFTDAKQPALQAVLGMNYKSPRPEWKDGWVPNKFYEAAYLKSADGKGYSFEYKIPWSLFGMKKGYQGGDLAAGAVQFNWGKANGVETGGAGSWCYDLVYKGGYPYQTSKIWGKIIFSKEGSIPKSMVEKVKAPPPPKPLSVVYEIPEKSVVTLSLFKGVEMVRHLVVQKPSSKGVNTVYWNGMNQEGKPLPPGKYELRGIYHKPITTKFLFSVHNAGNPPYKTSDNCGGWGGDHGVPSAACRAGENILLAWDNCEQAWGTILVDLTGRKIWGNRSPAEFLACDGKRFFTSQIFGFHKQPGVGVFDVKDGRSLAFGNGSKNLPPPDGGNKETNVVTGIACQNSKVFVSYKLRNLIAVYNSITGGQTAVINLKSPGAILADGNGDLFVISNGKVLKGNEKGDFKVFIDTHIDNPAGITQDVDGGIYISNHGQAQNVSVFNKQGKFLRTIGSKGGRPWKGLYKTDGMLKPTGICIGPKGRLWVAEKLDYPKRISVWDTKTGKFLKEFFGPTGYFGWNYMDPRKPEEIYCNNVIWKINWKNNTYKAYSTIWRATKPNVVKAPNPDGYNGHFRVVTAKNGKQYGFGISNNSPTLYQRSGDLFKPFASFIRMVRPPKYSPAGKQFPFMWNDTKKYPDGYYFWQDKNGDQTVQANEILKAGINASRNFQWLDRDLVTWSNVGTKLPPTKIDNNGRPWYDLEKITKISVKARIYSPFTDLTGKNHNFFSLSTGKDGFTCYDPKTWEPLWRYAPIVNWANSMGFPMPKAGDLWGATMPLGVADGFTGFGTYFGPYHIFTTDGMYVAKLFHDVREGYLGPEIVLTEAYEGQLVKPIGMNRYFLLAGDQDGRVSEVFGLDSVKKLPNRTITISREDSRKTADARQEYVKKTTTAKSYFIARGLAGIERSDAIERSAAKDKSFVVHCAYDKTNLYVKYDVVTSSPLVNNYNEDTTVFKGGNLLDIQVACDPKADPKRKKPAPGDVRLLISRRGGKTFAMMYQPKLNGFKGKPNVFTSPTGSESFDLIKNVSGEIKLIYKKTKTGFTALVTIPLKLINLKLKPLDKVRMDVGYIFGNKTGKQTALRLYSFNNGFSANVTYDVPNESRLSPTEWGTLIAE